MNLLQSIEHHLRKYRIAPSRFGRAALGDPGLVGALRRGREVRPATEARLRAYMAAATDEPA